MAEGTGERSRESTEADVHVRQPSNGEVDRTRKTFAAAIEAARNSGGNDEAWDRAEQLADTLQQPEELASAYRQAIEQDLERDRFIALARRAAAFFDEWYGDDPRAMQGLLGRIIERDPEATWAFERLTDLLASHERWDDLLGTFDRLLASTRDLERRKKLLDDAAHIAKDFAQRPSRAIEYMLLQLDLDPSNHALASAIERLLEREQRWKDLIALWKHHLPQLRVDDARRTRLRIATAYLDHLDAPAPALAELTALLGEVPGHEAACVQVERVLSWPDAPGSMRGAALDLLRANYEAAHRPKDVVKALQKAASFEARGARIPLVREAGVRLAILGEDGQAVAHYAELLALDPADADARRELRELARRSRLQSSFAAALVAAAESATPGQRADLLAEAAGLHRQALGQSDRAIELYTEVVGLAGEEPTLALAAAHQLNELLMSAGADARRLEILERIADLETATEVRRSVLGEAGRLADHLGQPDRALRAYDRRLQADPEDALALDASIQVLDRYERWAPLVSALTRRADARRTNAQRRADLVRVARLQQERLAQPPAAIETWLLVRRENGDEPETTAALDGLLAEARRYEELAEILAGASATGRTGSADLLARLGEVHQHHLGRPLDAASFYAQSLAIASTHPLARRGALQLTRIPACARTAATALAQAYRLGEEWEPLLDLVDVRIESATRPREAVEILREAATLLEREQRDVSEARRAIGRAFVLDPADPSLESELSRLAELSEGWAETARTFSKAAEAATVPARAAAIRRAEGQVREARLGDAPGAVMAYVAAAHLDPEDLPTQRAIIRASALAGTWPEAATSLVRICQARELVDDTALRSMTDAAERRDEWSTMLSATTQAIAAARIPASIARELEATCARGYRDALGDLDRAVLAAERAAVCDPHHAETLELLASVQRQRPEDRRGERPALAATLLRLDALQERNLDPLTEAAEICVEADADPPWRREVVARLYRKAARLLAQSESVVGTREPQSCALWAVEQLVRMDRDRKRYRDAVATLLAATDLPLEPRQRNELRIRTARMSAECGDRGRAIDLLSLVLLEQGDEVQLVAELAELCAKEGRVIELVRMRAKELDLTRDPQRRLALRLEMSRLVGEVERVGGRVESLKANLVEEPGHRDSIAALTEVTRNRGQVSELADLLTDQAQQLERTHAHARAAELWTDVARIAEQDLDDVPRAIAALRRVIVLAPSPTPMDTLARLHLHVGQPADAARVLAERLVATETDKRVPVLLRLAKAQIAAEANPDAMVTLRAAFDEAPKNAEARKLLLRLYREHERWPDLAECMSVAAAHVGDAETVVAYAKEASAIFHDRLGTPERAVEVLERALPLAPTDRELKSHLVEGLRVADRLEDAHRLAQDLIVSFGRRRSTQRAAAHMQLARVAHARGDGREALDQLEQAAAMDASSSRILRTLAELARELGQLDRCERAYRTLLIQVKRNPRHLQEGPEGERIGSAEVLYELSTLARQRGDTVSADELIESAIETLRSDDTEGSALQATLRKRGDDAFLQRVLLVRLDGATTVRQKADLLGELATLQEDALKQLDTAFESRLAAIRLDPGTPQHHERARELAARLDRLRDYVRFVEDMLDQARRNTDVYVRCELLLRLAEVTAAELGNPERAAELLKQAEELGVREVDVWRSATRIAASRGDAAEQMHYLERLAAIGEGENETRADTLYRMAEVQLAAAETQAQGIETLTAALESDPRHERALRILLRASEDNASLAVVDLLERVARKVGDAAILLKALERKAHHPESTPEDAREAVDLALERQEHARAEALMLRAVELANVSSEDGGGVRIGWALRGLAQQRQAADDLAAAVRWMCEAIAATPDINELLPQAKALAQACTQASDLPLAVRIYEPLQQRDANHRDVWEPLAELYRRLGETDRLRQLVEETLDSVSDEDERNALRLQLAQTLLQHPDREGHAIALLREILVETPDHHEAQRLMAEVLERTGREQELVDLVHQQWLAAQARGDEDFVVHAALRLSDLQRKLDLDQAAGTLRAALARAPSHVGLMRALLDLPTSDESERQELIERLIETEDADVAADLSLRLADLCAQRGDADAELRALQRGYRKHPSHEGLRARLEGAYSERNDHRGLAEMLVQSNLASPEQRVALLRQAATVYLERLGDSEAAIDALSQAYEIAPNDSHLGLEFAAVLASHGKPDRAADLVSDLLLAPSDDPAFKLGLHLRRAELRRIQGDYAGHVQDLEAAFAIDPAGIAPQLLDALKGVRDAAAAGADLEAERNATVRLADLLLQQGEGEQARAMLFDWVERERKDSEAIRRLRTLEEAVENWDQVKKLCARLVAIESGEPQIEAAIALAQACQRLGRPKDARPGLEHARRKQPENADVRRELMAIYEATGAEPELAALLLEEATMAHDAGQRADLLRRAAELFLRQQDVASALPALKELSASDPVDPWTTLALVDAEIALGQIDEAEATLDRAIEDAKARRTPELAQYYHRKARVVAARGDAQSQLNLLQQAFALDKNNGVIAADLADVAEAMEAWDLAIRVLRTITLIDTESPISRTQAFLRQARICHIRGDRQRAVLWARKAKHESPEDPEVAAFLGSLGEA